MAKKILFNQDAREALKRGVDAVADAVRITIGPRGRNVVLDKGYGAPTITNDGVTIAKEITLADKFENMGAEIVKEVATKTNDAAGDGTTTSVVLTQALVEAGFKKSSSGTNSMGIRRGIEAAAADAIDALKKMAKPIKADAEVRQVATISAESEEIGTIIANTIKKIGKDGVVTVEESQSMGIDSEIVEGLEFDKGYISAYMITNAERMEAEYRDPAILITDRKISVIKDILPLLEKLAASDKKDLVIIAEDVDGEALTTFVLNKLRGSFNVLAIKAPGYGDKKKELLADIAATVGAKVVSEDVGLTFEKAEFNMLGRASRVVSTKDSTIIVGGKGKKAEIVARVESLRAQLGNSVSKFDIEKLKERIGKLTGGVAVIKVGAATETEMKYLKLKIEDAVNATKAAIAEGVVAGGGSAYAKVSKKIEAKYKESKESKLAPENAEAAEFAAGYMAVVEALKEPLRQIARNAGKEDGVVLNEVMKGQANSGYNALTDMFVTDMFEEGIIDPVKVARVALENAASAVAILLTTEVAIADEPEKAKPFPDLPHSHGGMDY
ncbi:MAG: 60 kDa chaperonin [Parcubacteria group bacterium GW2011_GWB1_49_7]|uniref:Chaperonin GroEL n=1 Tax=Candidatus Zambryskibacteria bacterium RIFCSPHIGHO2_01_FULL_46_25 TaxID=1802738 RepID=A0A1G2SZ86_9BACT|nr:MAG: 60 kDa chaperonin [Parcubacteria group bacterium GW2011_GWA1_47_10]KKW09763.1 MAG: 60 kDa chaperonin [Parcubacteria group bacterium GW2011_GWB1_49_7]OHA90323.1 MAG: chaperonin GroL [Candidatus Zambryskibacteria bacterium RIFCSPHIGHO2_01_FULL_46_25]OHB01112.1 MAG: chaperonin GroL [Candidatus Zambryskibacteria bacterium RIFCSPHIGHO2_12_FULL_48_10]OHB06864.1 MAG: chaperonin GroL [Candidatus Zambryskibacteria bacterium RIFCSPLOWO2_01_FULL_48_25]